MRAVSFSHCRTRLMVNLNAVTGSAGRNKVKTNSSATASEDDVAGMLLPGMQDTHPALVSGPGARVVVHSQDTMPHPTSEGFDVPAEFSVTIGVSARENVRVSRPHGNCTRDERPPTESPDHTSSRSKYRSVCTRNKNPHLLYRAEGAPKKVIP